MPAPVINVAQMREWENASWAAGRTGSEVIGRVGELVAERARRMVRAGDSILLLAGSGHNGDDARAARKHLTGLYAHLHNVNDPETDLAEVTRLLAERPALIVDGL